VMAEVDNQADRNINMNQYFISAKAKDSDA
jgi:hypothetical protein